ncbi:unnamed protein product [Spirodela intermedia]|uniref:Uncharacterized protein n=1 Tax=Spirodela intermedia TaxID=51605 RepID=A0A7I8IK12_SPIIN|nr:unnamed protein product [Spirodela intermedia]CAA6657834.1 unnamed protein product [Spirodela intermedia]
MAQLLIPRSRGLRSTGRSGEPPPGRHSTAAPCMASALLASSRNEPFWGEPKVYMRKNPSPNPNPNPRPASDNRSKDRPRVASVSSPFLDRLDHAAGTDEPTSASYAAVPAASDDSSSFNHHKASGKPSNHQHYLTRPSRKESGFDSAYVTFDIATCSRRELQELKRRLISELEQVRSLSNRIKSGDLQTARSACFSTSGYGGGGDRRTPKGGNHYLLPAAESPLGGCSGTASFPHGDNDKNLSVGKRSLPLTSPREAKRQATGESEKLLAVMMKKCVQILTKLMKHRYGWVFNTPVDVMGLGLHDYHQIIKRPMDLGTVKSKLDKSSYTSPVEFAADIRLTFNNALLYNPEGHDVHKMAEQLLNLFEKLFADAYKAYDKQTQFQGKGDEEERNSHSGSNVHLPQEEAAAHIQPVAPPAKPEMPAASVPTRPAVGKQPKPKAKDPKKREMSFEEKKKLSLGLQSLPQEKMAQVLQIVQRRNPDPALHGDEIELDFETLDTETLWELDRFVGNCKKMMSKMKRQEAILAAAPGGPGPTSETAENNTARRVGKKAGELGEEDVDIGEDMPSSHFPPVEIEKDTGNHSESSSSSSSSGSDSSSSSDSDSRSSAESDSDADDAQSPAVG